MKFFTFDNHNLSIIFKGNWQLAGGHGDVNREQAIIDLFKYVEKGVNVFDVGDIYTGVEEIVGEFITRYRTLNGDKKADLLRVHTKFVPDLNALEGLTRKDVRFVIERSLKRLGLKKLNLVQFHWWDYSKGDYLKTAKYLKELQDEGLIEAIGLTNFDSRHTQALIDAGVPILSNQIQFSLIDPRPLNGMLELARRERIAIFCYGTLAGGLLAGSQPGDEPTNRSHIKYQLVVDEVGEKYYQSVMQLVANIANKHKTSLANIAAAYVLQTPGVSGVILGPRNNKHLNEVDNLTEIHLSEEEYSKLAKLQKSLLKTNTDDIYSYERNTVGPHGKIMKYNLNGMHIAHTF
jgi:aryl-alcohol dehydrogenase-like predicted oxidoreductase